MGKKLKEVTIEDLRRFGFGLFEREGEDRLRIVARRGTKYINMYIHDTKDEDFKREGDVLIDKQGKRFKECAMCGSIHNVRYVVPYDGSAKPGAYCYYCRRKNSIMDVEDAKRYGKIL